MKNRRKLAGVTKDDLMNVDLLSFPQLAIYVTGICHDKLRMWCDAGIFPEVDGKFSRKEVDYRLEHLGDYSHLIISKNQRKKLGPTAQKFLAEIENNKS